jgi:hypothetical protein
MDPQLEAAVKRHTQIFGSYTRAGELKQVRVWLILNDGKIEFLTPGGTLKAKRVGRNPRVECLVGDYRVTGTAEVVRDKDALLRGYRAYRKAHPFIMLFIGSGIRSRINSGQQVLIRITPDEPNPLKGVSDPIVD